MAQIIQLIFVSPRRQLTVIERNHVVASRKLAGVPLLPNEHIVIVQHARAW